MADMRRTLLWVVFVMSLVMLWDAWNRHNGEPTLFGAPVAGAPAASAAPNPASGAATLSPPVAAGTTAAAPAGVAAVPSQTFDVTTDLMRVRLGSRGGEVSRVELLAHADKANPSGHVVLLDESAARVYLAQTGFLSGASGTALPDHFTAMSALPGERALAAGQNQFQVRFESAVVGGAKWVKTYTFTRGSYQIGVKNELVNVGSVPLQPQLYLQLLRDGAPPEHQSSLYFTFTGPALYTDAGKFEKIEFKDIDKRGPNEAPSHQTRADNGWIAMVQHYFVSAWLMPQGMPRELRTTRVGNNLYSIAMVEPLGLLAPGAAVTRDATLYVGPQEENKLAAMAPGLELVKDYGFIHILAQPLFWLLDKVHGVLGNWGWSIVALVVLLKIVFYGLNAKAYKSMARMRAVSPRLQALKARYEGKPQEMQQEMMRIYREEKINPLGGCLPILVQMPFFIALYWVLLSTVEMRGAPWIGWVTDLSAPDALFGVLPLIGMPVGPLPLLLLGSSLLMQWLQPTPTDPMQAKMMWMMPLIFGVMFFFFPSGLVLYWLTNNLLSIVQQWLINKQLGVQ